MYSVLHMPDRQHAARIASQQQADGIPGGGSGVDRKSIDGRPRSTVLCTRTGQGLLYAQVMRMPSPAEPWPCPSTLTALSPLAFALDQGARNSETCPVSRVRLYLHTVRRNEDQTESTSRSDDRCITGGPLHAQGCSVQVPVHMYFGQMMQGEL